METTIWFRLTPPYALMILITAGIYSKFGGGPLWPEINSYQNEECAKYWWTHLLYINNIYPVKNSGVRARAPAQMKLNHSQHNCMNFRFCSVFLSVGIWRQIYNYS